MQENSNTLEEATTKTERLSYRRPQVKINGIVHNAPTLTADIIEELKEQYAETRPHLCRTCGIKSCTRFNDMNNDDIEEGLCVPDDIYITQCKAYTKKRKIVVIYKPLTEGGLTEKYFDFSQAHITDRDVAEKVHKL